MTILGYSYSRVSTKPQEDKVSLAEQEQAILAYAAQHGIQVPDECRFRETWSRYELWDRPGLDRIRADIRARKFEALICYSIDRLSGDLGHVMVVVAECQQFGVELHFVSESFDDTPEGKLLRAVKAYTAEIERVRMYERMVVRGKRGRLKSGKLLNAGVDLYGYRRDREKGVRIIYEPEARIVREMFEMRAIRGMSEWAIAKELNSRNVPAPSAGKKVFKDGRTPIWCKSSVERILHHQGYYGLTVTWKWRSSGTSRKRKTEPRPEEEHIILPEGTTPAIVSEDIWRAANERRRRPWIRADQSKLKPALLRGHIFCARCGRSRSPDSHNCGYVCTSQASPFGWCGGSSVPMKTVEAWVWGEISKIIKNPENTIEALSSELKTGSDIGERLQADIDNANQQIRKIRARQEKLIAAFADAEGVEDLVKKQIQTLTAERQNLERQVEQLERALAAQVDQRQHWLALVKLCASLADTVDALSLEEKREWLKVLGVRVVGEGRSNWKLELGLPILTDPGGPGGAGGPGGLTIKTKKSGPSILILWSEFLPDKSRA